MRSRWPILTLLGLLASLLVPGWASASTVTGAETPSWAFDLADQVGIGVERSLAPPPLRSRAPDRGAVGDGCPSPLTHEATVWSATPHGGSLQRLSHTLDLTDIPGAAVREGLEWAGVDESTADWVGGTAGFLLSGGTSALAQGGRVVRSIASGGGRALVREGVDVVKRWVPGGAGRRAVAARGGRTVIGKLDDIGAGKLRSGENNLLKHLEGDLGSPRASWGRNSSVLRTEMRKGLPIRDASVDPAGALINDTGFLRAERNLLRNQGWTYDPGTTLWSPPR